MVIILDGACCGVSFRKPGEIIAWDNSDTDFTLSDM